MFLPGLCKKGGGAAISLTQSFSLATPAFLDGTRRLPASSGHGLYGSSSLPSDNLHVAFYFSLPSVFPKPPIPRGALN